METITPLNPDLAYTYVLGSGEASFAVSDYLQEPDCELSLTSIEITLVTPFEGAPSPNITTSKLMMTSGLPQLAGKTLVYQVTASMVDLTNPDALIEITFLLLPGTSNQAPYFKTEPPTPELIPCSSANTALRWSYTMGQAIDPEEASIEVNHECLLLPINFFKVSFEENSLQQ